MRSLILPKNLQGKYKKMMKGKSIAVDKDVVMKTENKEPITEPMNQITSEMDKMSFVSLNPNRKPLKYKI